MTSDGRTVAIVAWGDLLIDWLDQLGVSLAEFRDVFTGSWMFGYARALQHAGARPIIVAMSARVAAPQRSTHGPTGVPLYVLPPPRPYRALRPLLLEDSLRSSRNPVSVARAVVTHATPHLATPPLALARVLRAERCAAVLVQEYETPRFDVCVALGHALGLPVFATFQGGDYQASRVEALVRPLSLRLAAGLIIAARSERDRIRDCYGVPDEKVHRIFNPVDTEFWRADDRTQSRRAEALPVGAEIVVWHGQAHPRKGLTLLLDAWRRVCADRPDRSLVLVLFGGRRGSDRLAVEVRRSGVPSVHVLDEWILDPVRVRRLLSAEDVYAFPSQHEGFPVAPLEAMACGLPVVTTDAPGMSDIFANGERDGGMVAPRGDAAAFAAALGTLLDNPSRREDLAARARRRVETAFALGHVGEQLAAVLAPHRILSEPDGR